MDYLHHFVSAMGTTGLVVAFARLLLSFISKEPGNSFPTLCIGVGFLIGRYSVSGSPDDFGVRLAMADCAGSAACLAVAAAAFRYRASQMMGG